jgi:hypothetical protein
LSRQFITRISRVARFLKFEICNNLQLAIFSFHSQLIVSELEELRLSGPGLVGLVALVDPLFVGTVRTRLGYLFDSSASVFKSIGERT